MKEKVKQLIVEYQTANGNKSGTTIITLKDKTGLPVDYLSDILNQLYKEKFIDIRQGINNKLIFLNKL